jgi:iron complex outermembrane receptor protein
MSRVSPRGPAWRPRLLAAALAAAALPSVARAQSSDTGLLSQIFQAPVTSSATGLPQRVDEAPADMEIVTQDDIRRSGATSIPEALAFVPGVTVRQYGIADFEVGIRGYNQPYNPRLLVLVNGREVYEQGYNHVPWAEIPVQLEEIRQIEVIKGPNSALYGFNAVGGVINIITYDPLTDPELNVATLRGGTQSYLSGSAVTTVRMGRDAGLRLSAGGMRAQDFAPGPLAPHEAAVRPDPLIGTLAVQGSARPAPGVALFLEASGADTRDGEDSFTGNFITMTRRSSAFRLGGSVDTRWGLFGLNAWRDEALSSLDFTQSLPGAWVDQVIDVVQGSLLSKLSPDHTLRLGVEYRHNQVTSPLFVNGTVAEQVLSASGMWSWRLRPGLTLTNALRSDTLALSYHGTPVAGSPFTVADYNHAGLTEVSYNGGLVYEATDRDTLRLLLARGVQLPSLLDFGAQTPIDLEGPAAIVGNPTVAPSVVWNAELDYDRTLPAWHSTLRTAIFAQRNDDLINPPFSSAPRLGPGGVPVLVTANVGRSDAMGGEVGLRGQSPSGIRWNASYALAITTDHTSLNQGSLPTSAIDYAHSTPRHIVTLGLGYTWQRLELDAQARWQSTYRDFRVPASSPLILTPVNVPNELTVNARLGYRVTDQVTLALSGQQLTVPNLATTAGPPVERRLILSLTARF